jgi:ribosomal protein L34E
VTGSCEHRAPSFGIEIFHNGFDNSSHACCGECGMTAILSAWSKRWPVGVKRTQTEISPDIQQHLMPCKCGGKLSKGNFPRCPKCKQALSAEAAARDIEPQSPGTKKGWRWQRGWDGLDCAVINDQCVKDNFINHELDVIRPAIHAEKIQ